MIYTEEMDKIVKEFCLEYNTCKKNIAKDIWYSEQAFWIWKNKSRIWTRAIDRLRTIWLELPTETYKYKIKKKILSESKKRGCRRSHRKPKIEHRGQ